MTHPVTPDGRYFVVRGRLWPMADPGLTPARRDMVVKQLMNARRALRHDAPPESRAAARDAVDPAKLGLGERGPVWWGDDAPDFSRTMVENTPYAAGYASLLEAPPPVSAAATPAPQTTGGSVSRS